LVLIAIVGHQSDPRQRLAGELEASEVDPIQLQCLLQKAAQRVVADLADESSSNAQASQRDRNIGWGSAGRDAQGARSVERGARRLGNEVNKQLAKAKNFERLALLRRREAIGSLSHVNPQGGRRDRK
jgi:hypothetical protein